MNDNENELAKKIRFQLLEDQVRLETLKKVFISDIDMACSSITRLRTELLSLINSDRKDKEVD
jgi:uncharacterized membrane protein YheB (UPF0754 family)